VEELVWPEASDVEYITSAQAGGWGDMLLAFVRFLGLPPGGRVLDAGSGPALLPRLMVGAGARLAVACDDSWPMALRARELSAATSGVVQVTGLAVPSPFADGAFDAVLATNLLFLLPDAGAGLEELARSAMPGGTVGFANPTATLDRRSAGTFAEERGLRGFARISWINYGRLAEGGRRLTAPQWLELAEGAGLVDLRSQTRAGGHVAFVAGKKRGA
jgi:SAM-dependent methyltransferase